jgi:hypothetical protein
LPGEAKEKYNKRNLSKDSRLPGVNFNLGLPASEAVVLHIVTQISATVPLQSINHFELHFLWKNDGCTLSFVR